MQQGFFNRVLKFFLALAAVKLVLLIIAANRAGSVGLKGGLVVLVISFVVLVILLLLLKQPSGSDGYSRGDSSVLLEESLFDKLRRRYESIAEEYRKDGNYIKASHIHLKLLQNPYRAAAVLEEGGCYNEAAVIYLKKLDNKYNAAQCYEKGKNYKKAIELYKDLGDKEKMGDIYMLLNDRTTANGCYESVIADYTAASQFVKASLLARHKMQDNEKARKLLLAGWSNNADAFNCINNYFASFADFGELKTAIEDVYAATPRFQKETLLTALTYEFKKGKEMEELTADIAYEIIADFIQQKPSIAPGLKHFNPGDKIIIKDIIRYKAATNKITANYVPGNMEELK